MTDTNLGRDYATAPCLALIVLLLPAYPLQATETTSGKIFSLELALEATHFIDSFKTGIRQALQESGKIYPYLNTLLAIDNRRLETIFARVFARHLTPKQIEA